MKIVLISKLWEEASPESVGGTGVFIGSLANELTQRGHKVFLFATANSTKKVTRLFSVIKKPFHLYSESLHYLNIASGFEYGHKVKADIIHACVDHTSLYFSRLSKIPVLHTLDYGDVFADEQKILKKYKTENFVTISYAMEKRFPYLNWQKVIYHGVDLKKFPKKEREGGYLLFLGRLSPQKGPDLAIKLAKKAKIPLVLAGKMTEVDKEYLDKKVLPFIDGKFIKYVGVAKFQKKINLLKNAIALLHPANFFEAFGITLIEAQACGTPVLAFDRGAIKEIVKSGKTGFVVKTLDEMIKKVRDIKKIDPRDCRRFVEKNFSLEKMVSNYEELYQKMTAKKS